MARPKKVVNTVEDSSADMQVTPTLANVVSSSKSPVLRRKARPIINGRRDVLSIKNKEPGFVYRIFNANGPKDLARIEDMKEIGYELVDHPIEVGDRTANTASTLGTAEVHTGSGTKGLVMRIPKEYYDEDQSLKQRAILDTERATRDKSGHRDVDFGSVEIKNS